MTTSTMMSKPWSKPQIYRPDEAVSVVICLPRRLCLCLVQTKWSFSIFLIAAESAHETTSFCHEESHCFETFAVHLLIVTPGVAQNAREASLELG